MNTEQKENIIKDLLYEHSSREMLMRYSRKQKIKKMIFQSLAAASVLAVGVIGFQYLSKDPVDRELLAGNQYVFPVVQKSRSMQTNQVDQYAAQLQNKEYDLVLHKLNNDSITETDRFVKVNLLYALDSIQKADLLIGAYEWQDPYLTKEIAWLDFLVEVRKGSSKSTLLSMVSLLSDEHKIRAKTIIEKL